MVISDLCSCSSLFSGHEAGKRPARGGKHDSSLFREMKRLEVEVEGFTEGLCPRVRGRSFHGEGLKRKKAWGPTLTCTLAPIDPSLKDPSPIDPFLKDL